MRLRLPALAATALVAAFLPPAGAAGCDDATDQATLNACAARHQQEADAELNRVYGEIVRRLGGDSGTLDRLRDAQRAWIGFRDAECAFASSGAAGGSAFPMVMAGCMAGMTEARTEELEEYLHCEEGDLDCPVPAE